MSGRHFKALTYLDRHRLQDIRAFTLAPYVSIAPPTHGNGLLSDTQPIDGQVCIPTHFQETRPHFQPEITSLVWQGDNDNPLRGFTLLRRQQFRAIGMGRDYEGE